MTDTTGNENGNGVSPEILAKAKLYGWKEDYRGDNPISAEEFVKRADDRLDIAKGTLRTVEKTNTALSAQNRELSEKLGRMEISFKQFVEMSRKAEDRAYAKAKAELEAKLDDAVEAGDKEVHRQVLGEIRELDKTIAEHPALTGTEKPAQTSGPEGWQTSAEVQAEWEEENSWFGEDVEMAIYAESVDRVFAKSKSGRQHKSQRERLDAVTEAVKKKFPEHFGIKPAAAEPAGVVRRSAVEGGGMAPASGGGKKSYADLPADAKRMCDELVKDGILKREDYVNTYQWEK